MNRRLLLLAVLVAATAFAADALPAFSADNGTIVGTVSAAAPPAPCIELSSTSANFGTASFAPQLDYRLVPSDPITFTNCGAAVSSFEIVGTDAAGPSGPWTLTDEWLLCDGRLNRYGLLVSEQPEGWEPDSLSTIAKTLSHHRPPANMIEDTFDPGEAEAFKFLLAMPCVGSNGAGETFSFTIGLMATVA
jgi:hypothetical protein